MKPVKVTDVDVVFGGNLSKLLPSMKDIPEEFKEGNTKWNKVIEDWFFNGLNDCKWKPKKGINTKDAVRHIAAILISYDPRHEHKMAGCAYLLSQFFDDVQYSVKS